MKLIGTHKLWSFVDGSVDAQTVESSKIRNGAGHSVDSYIELARKVAELQFRNRDFVLLFRGQHTDYKNAKGNSTLKPTLFRALKAGNPNPGILVERFKTLKRAEGKLAGAYQAARFLGSTRLKRQRILQWAILQHYEVCPTPLLDVTGSLRVAASFASYKNNGQGFVYVIGAPNLSGAITASSEADLQIVRLASACPPSALRPHIQEGYLLGEYPELADYDQKVNYKHYEMDFGRRLVAKFCFAINRFWKDATFPQVSNSALYPSAADDPLSKLALKVKGAIEREED